MCIRDRPTTTDHTFAGLGSQVNFLVDRNSDGQLPVPECDGVGSVSCDRRSWSDVPKNVSGSRTRTAESVADPGRFRDGDFRVGAVEYLWCGSGNGPERRHIDLSALLLFQHSQPLDDADFCCRGIQDRETGSGKSGQ